MSSERHSARQGRPSLGAVEVADGFFDVGLVGAGFRLGDGIGAGPQGGAQAFLDVGGQ